MKQLELKKQEVRGEGREALCEEEGGGGGGRRGGLLYQGPSFRAQGLVSRLVLYRDLQQLQCILIRLGFTIAIAVVQQLAVNSSSSLTMAV